MGTLGKVIWGALAGAATLAAAAGVYCTLCKEKEEYSEDFAEIERRDLCEQQDGSDDNHETV